MTPARVLFSDLHGNLAALRALVEQEPDSVLISAGDVLGSGGGNQDCLDLMAARGIRSVLGNHEADLLRLYAPGLTAAAWSASAAGRPGSPRATTPSCTRCGK